MYAQNLLVVEAKTNLYSKVRTSSLAMCAVVRGICLPRCCVVWREGCGEGEWTSCVTGLALHLSVWFLIGHMEIAEKDAARGSERETSNGQEQHQETEDWRKGGWRQRLLRAAFWSTQSRLFHGGQQVRVDVRAPSVC